MRPGLNILEPELIGRIVDEAKRVLAEHGFEIRGAEITTSEFQLRDWVSASRALRPLSHGSGDRVSAWRALRRLTGRPAA